MAVFRVERTGDYTVMSNVIYISRMRENQSVIV